MKKIKCLVTGGAGFIGSNLVDELVKRNYEVSIIDNLISGKKKNINSKVNWYDFDIANYKDIRPIFTNIDYVFHTAALSRIPLSIEKPLLANDSNINGTLNVLYASKKANVKKVIYSASSSVYGNQSKLPFIETMEASPLNPYALQKYVGELYCKIFSDIYKLPTVSLRYFNAYGSRQSDSGAYATVIGYFLKLKDEKKYLTITGDGEQMRDFIYVSDVVNANILAMESIKVGKGEVINIGSSKGYSINDIAKLINYDTVYIPLPLGEMRSTLADITLAKTLLNWEPEYDLEEGFQKTLKWYNSDKSRG